MGRVGGERRRSPEVVGSAINEDAFGAFLAADDEIVMEIGREGHVDGAGDSRVVGQVVVPGELRLQFVIKFDIVGVIEDDVLGAESVFARVLRGASLWKNAKKTGGFWPSGPFVFTLA